MRLSPIFAALMCHLAHQVLAAHQGQTFSFYVALESTGILEIHFDPAADVNSSLSIAGYNTNAGHMVNWLTPYLDRIYSISRTYFPNKQSTSGGLFAFQEPPISASTSANLTLLNAQGSGGLGGAYCDVSPDGKTLAAANIDGSSVSIHPLFHDGTIGDATHVFHYTIPHPGPGLNDSQVIANPHESIFDPTGQFLFVPDRGSDRLYIYSVEDPWHVTQIQNITFLPGTGPRHLTFQRFNATRNYMYLVSELDNSIRVFALDYPKHNPADAFSFASTNLTVTHTQTISTLSKNHPRTPPINHDLAAEVAVTNDGRFLYASNRNTLSLDSDTLTVFSINSSSAKDAERLTYLGHNATLGKIPRHFALSNDVNNTWVAVANEVTQDIVVFERDVGSGFMLEVRGRIALGELDLTQKEGPICVLWK